MRRDVIALMMSLGATTALAAQPVVTENLTGTISGQQTVDVKGYFGKPGADLSGAAISIYLQYAPTLLGPTQTCRTHACTYHVSTQMPDTSGSLLVTVTVNGHRLVYSPSYEGAVFLATQKPYQLTVDSDAFSGFGVGLPGIQLATLFTSAPVFGKALSPGNGPVSGPSASDYVAFFVANNQSPDEQLTYAPTSGTK